ncbi:MAG: sugar ABC transporter ATP-binding protein, partial [Hyphomicrobiales bacterium]|nr:sugar ABC transporter ATP-binding protein [Hyphomicrobiales bacterium]
MAIPAAGARAISKHFGATRALDGVDFDVLPGEVHALVGENGAGKSTLVRILAGVHRPDAGEIAIDGRVRQFGGPRDAIAAGVISIPQELRLVPALSVAENLTLGDPPLR